VLGLGGELLSRSEGICGGVKRNTLRILIRLAAEDLEKGLSNTFVEVAEVVKKLPSSKVPGVDEIHTEMLKALDIVGLSWLTFLFNVI